MGCPVLTPPCQLEQWEVVPQPDRCSAVLIASQILMNLLSGELTSRSCRSRSQQPVSQRGLSAARSRFHTGISVGEEGEESQHGSVCSRNVLNIRAEHKLRNPLVLFLFQW